MSTQVGAINKTFKSATDLSAKQYYIVKLSALDTVALAAAGTDAVIGTIQNVPVSSGLVEVAVGGGTAKVKLGSGGATRGAHLTSDASGTAVVTTTDGDQVIGRALQAGSEGDVIEYQIANSRIYTP